MENRIIELELDNAKDWEKERWCRCSREYHKSSQVKTRQNIKDKPRQDKPRQNKTQKTRQDKTIQDKIREDKEKIFQNIRGECSPIFNKMETIFEIKLKFWF